MQNEPYDKKADIWAIGCILYEMAVFVPPFPSSNMLTLAMKVLNCIISSNISHS